MAKLFAAVASGVPALPAKNSVSSNQVVCAAEVITVTAAQLTLNALLGSIYVPKGAEILAVQLYATDLDTNGTPLITLGIGDVNDDDRLMTANTLAQTGAVPVGPSIAIAGFGYQYAAETLISVKVLAAPATAAAGTIKYVVWYVSNG